MYLKKAQEKDYSTITKLIRTINRSCRDYFVTSYQEQAIVDLFITRTEGLTGTLAVIEKEDHVIAYIAFLNNAVPIALMEEVNQHIQGYIDRYVPEKAFYLNIGGRQEDMMQYFRDKGFRPDMYGIEFTYDKIPESFSFSTSNLTIKGLEEDYLDDYIALLDRAFKPLDEQNGREPNPFGRNREETIKDLIEDHKRDDFGALWDQEQLVGIFRLYQDYIYELAIDPRFQRRGYGEESLKYCLNKMINERKLKKVYLRTEIINTKAQGFYLKNGFKITGTFGEHTYHVEGSKEA